MKLLEFNTRTNASNLGENMVVEVPETQKNMINMKYDLKRMKTRLDNDKFDVKEMMKIAGINEKKKIHNLKTFKHTSHNHSQLAENSFEEDEGCKCSYLCI